MERILPRPVAGGVRVHHPLQLHLQLHLQSKPAATSALALGWWRKWPDRLQMSALMFVPQSLFRGTDWKCSNNEMHAHEVMIAHTCTRNNDCKPKVKKTVTREVAPWNFGRAVNSFLQHWATYVTNSQAFVLSVNQTWALLLAPLQLCYPSQVNILWSEFFLDISFLLSYTGIPAPEQSDVCVVGNESHSRNDCQIVFSIFGWNSELYGLPSSHPPCCWRFCFNGRAAVLMIYI